jgi:hypothetical protein
MGCDYALCCAWPQLIARSRESPGDTHALVAAVSGTFPHGAWHQPFIDLQSHLLSLARRGDVQRLAADARFLGSLIMRHATAPDEGKDPDPCYCGHGLGVHAVIKDLFAAELSAPGLRSRLLNVQSRATGLVRAQSCDGLEFAAIDPAQSMVDIALTAECLPSVLVTHLFCAQKQLLVGDVERAVRFGVAAFIGSTLVPQCLTGVGHARSAWPYTLADAAVHARALLELLDLPGDPLAALWVSGAPAAVFESEEPSPCLSELTPACVVHGQLLANMPARFCDEEGLHTILALPWLAVHDAHTDAWLLPVTSLYNPYHALHWAVSAFSARRPTGMLILWPTDWAKREVAAGTPLPFMSIAKLLAADVRLARDVDACFTSLRVGRGRLLDATVFAEPASPVHFAALAGAAIAAYPSLPPFPAVVFVSRPPSLGRQVPALPTAALAVGALLIEELPPLVMLARLARTLVVRNLVSFRLCYFPGLNRYRAFCCV